MRVRVLGVDPGLTRCGLGVVDSASGRAVTCVDVGVVRSGTDVALEHRLAAVADAVEDWVARHRPDVVAVERVFSQHNVRTVMGTAQASGVVALVAARAGLPVAFHTPSEVKAAVTGEGRAGKAQVASMVTRLLGLAETPRPADAADALALAICHCWRAPMQDRMADARARAEELARTHRARMSEAARTAASGAASGAAARTAAARTATVGSDVAGGRTARSGPARPDAARADAVRSDAVRSDAVGTDVTGPGAAGDAGVGQTSETWAEVVARRARSAGSPGARGTVRGRTGVRAQDHGGRPAAPGTSRRAPGAAQAERGAGAPDRQE